MSNESNTPSSSTPAPSAAVETNQSQESQVDAVNAEATEVEAEADSSEEGDAPAEQSLAEKKKEIKALKRKLKLKVDGKEIEEEVDLDNDEYLVEQLQQAKAFQKRSREYAQLEKEVFQFINDLKRDPRKVLADPSIGIDIKQLAAQVIEEEIKNAEKTPEQLEREKIENELKSLREEREKEKEEFRAKELERLQELEFQRYDQLMTDALSKSKLPKSDYVVKRMADYMIEGLQKGIDVTPEDVVPLVEEQMRKDLAEMFKVMPDDVIEAMVGKEVITRLRKKNVVKAKQATPPPTSKVVDIGMKKDESKPEKKLTIRDWLKV